MTHPSIPDGFSTPTQVRFSRRTMAVGYTLVLAALYLGSYLGLHLLSISFRTPFGISPWYPPAALSLVMVLWGGRPYVPCVFIAAFGAEQITHTLGASIATSLVLGLIVMVGYGGAALMLRQFLQLNPELCRLRDIVWLIGVGMLLAPFCVATSAVLVLNIAGAIPDAEVQASLLTFWIGDAIGIGSVAPFLLAVLGRIEANPTWLRMVFRNINLELCAQIVSIGLVVWVGVAFQHQQTISSFYFCILPLLWIAIRQGFFRITFGVLFTNIALTVFLLIPDQNPVLLVDLQIFMLVLSLTGLIVGAVVTERQRAEKELYEREAYFRSLIENASDFISIIDVKGTIYYESPSSQRIFGYPGGLVGENAFDFIHPDDRNEVMMLFKRKLSNQQIGHNVYYRFRNNDGTWRYLESSGNIIRGSFPRQLRVIINSRDITERKRVEEALAAVVQGVASSTGNGFYQTLVFHLTQALQVEIGFVGLYNQQTQQITTIAVCDNGVFLDNFTFPVTGRACEAVVAQGISIVPQNAWQQFPDDDGLQRRQIETYMGISLINGTKTVIGVLVVMAKNPMPDIQLKVSLLSIFAQRVTAEIERSLAEETRLQIERKLLETQKLESLGLLAGGIAHDFNNFLTTIMGNVGLAMLESEHDSTILAYLNTIEIATRRAADLSRQMLAYSGKGRFIVSPMSINELVEEMTSLLHVSIGKQIRLAYSFEPNLPLVEIDATQIRQVVMNLIVNASDAIGSYPGQITIRTGVMRAEHVYMLEPHLAPDQGSEWYVFIEVSDTGNGMDPETQARIFEPFFTTKFTGRGLGLAAVQGIVRSHGGMLKVASQLGRGSTFKVFLPCANAIAPVAAPALLPIQKQASGLVLVVDDEDAIRLTIVKMIEGIGFETLHAATGAAGLALLDQHGAEIVAVLLDMTMPGLDGEATFGEMQRRGWTMPVILMSGYSQSEAINRLVNARLAGFIHKPFTLNELQSKVMSALAEHITTAAQEAELFPPDHQPAAFPPI